MAMKVNADGVRATRTSNQKSASKQFLIIIVLILCVVITVVINVVINNMRMQVVEVLVFKENVNQGDLITEDMIDKRPMIADEYDNLEKKVLSDGTERRVVMLYDDAKFLFKQDSYAANYIRAGSSVYFDYFTTSTIKKNSYLYEMDGELIKLAISANSFGDMVVPGDRVNIRCLYTDTSYKIPTIAEFEAMQQLGLETQTTEEKMIMLFSEVPILDMLNSAGESIFDYYYDFITWPTTKQNEALQDSSFKEKTAPSEILLCVTAEEADQYMRIQNKGPQYMLTLLPRESSNVILDALQSIKTGSGF